MERNEAYFLELPVLERNFEEIALVVAQIAFDSEIVNEIAGVVENNTAIVLLDRLNDVRAVTVNEIRTSIDEPVAERNEPVAGVLDPIFPQ
ncbi:hypothetical protein GCM10009000_043850 [Halobacterium noricense]|uniref:Uncharacterized protein n=1 Tax=Haladaptatus pallidirubidus TaxID=1008152 RepID=A0AAV3UFP3_9EURY